MDKGHGRIEERALWVCQTEPQTLGLAGAAQVLRIERKIDQVRGGQVVKHTEETVFGVTSLWPEEAGAQRLLALVRDHWKIENGQHHRRDRTQDEDRCMVRQSNTARVLSLFRSLAIFLHEAQRSKRGGKKSLPDFERHNLGHPGGLIRRFMPAAP
jgi:predicted transposase YbfD/YdcC